MQSARQMGELSWNWNFQYHFSCTMHRRDEPFLLNFFIYWTVGNILIASHKMSFCLVFFFNGDSYYRSFSSCCCNKYSDKDNLREKGWILGCSSKCSPLWQGSQSSRRLAHIYNRETEREECMLLLSSLSPFR